MKSGPKYGIGTGSREDPAFKKRLESLQDPGNYNVDTSNMGKNGARYGFGSEKRGADLPGDKDKKLGPGVGSYELPSSIDKGPKYGMGKRYDSVLSRNNKLPGPGSYE